jgi:hypothetical protein
MLMMLIILSEKHRYHEERHRSSVRGWREVGLETSAEKTKHMITFHHQTHYLLIANKCFENVVKFRY